MTAASAVYAYLAWCAPCGARDAPLTEEEEEAVQRLRERALLPFDAAEDSHVALLALLWARACPARPLPAPKGAHWGELGWQGHDPATDLRAAGHLAAHCLLFFAEQEGDAFRRLLRKEDGVRSEWEYPFCVGGVNLAAALVDALGVAKLLPQRASKAPLAPNRAFAALQARQPHAFERLFCAAFLKLDQEWLRQKADYMAFNEVLRTVTSEAAIEQLLAELGATADA